MNFDLDPDGRRWCVTCSAGAFDTQGVIHLSRHAPIGRLWLYYNKGVRKKIHSITRWRVMILPECVKSENQICISYNIIICTFIMYINKSVINHGTAKQYIYYNVLVTVTIIMHLCERDNVGNARVYKKHYILLQ